MGNLFPYWELKILIHVFTVPSDGHKGVFTYTGIIGVLPQKPMDEGYSLIDFQEWP